MEYLNLICITFTVKIFLLLKVMFDKLKNLDIMNTVIINIASRVISLVKNTTLNHHSSLCYGGFLIKINFTKKKYI